MWHLFAPSLERGQRIHGNVGGRFVTAIRLTNGKLKCIDSTCYHAGGPLGIGEIEELNGESCIKCPWHAYPVSLEDGSKFYQALELDKATRKLLPAGWKRKERAQRVHDVEERGKGEIWVRLSQNPEKFDSDEYAGSAVCAERVLANDFAGQKKGRDGVMPSSGSSGQVFQEQRWRPCKVLSVERDGMEGIRLRVQGGLFFRPREYPTLVMDAAELFEFHPYVVVRIGSVTRYYTPVVGTVHAGDSDDVMTLSVRVYPGSLVAGSLSRLKPGDVLDVRKAGETDPPAANLSLLASARFLPQKFKRALLVAGGSGITPMIALSHSIINNTPETIVTLLCFDRSPETVLCRDVVAALVAKYPKRVMLIRAYSHKVAGVKPTHGEVSVYSEQKISSDFVKKFIFPRTQSADERILVSWCGPPGFVEATRETLGKAGFSSDNSFLVPFTG